MVAATFCEEVKKDVGKAEMETKIRHFMRIMIYQVGRSQVPNLILEGCQEHQGSFLLQFMHS